MKPELKPCPFCSVESAKVMKKVKYVGHTGVDEPVEHLTASVQCNCCNAQGPTVGGKVIRAARKNRQLPAWAMEEWEIREKAIEAWNRRTEVENEN